MITIYKEIEDKLTTIENVTIDENSELEPRTWICIDGDVEFHTLEILAEKTQIPLDFFKSALDEEEMAHIDNEDKNVLIVLDVPCQSDDEEKVYTTEPFMIAYNRSYMVTINRYHSTLKEAYFAKAPKVEPHKHFRTSLNLIYRLSKEFVLRLRDIDNKSKVIESKLQTSMKNKELLELKNLNKTLVYFQTALTSNKAVLYKLLKSPNYPRYEADYDLMQDTEVELDQAMEMCKIYREILSGMLDVYSSIVSNNLNIVMKTLSVITIIISIPTLIASFFGMNFVEFPLDDNPYGFYITLAVAAFLAILGTIVLLYVSNKRRD